jgi:hypothetical protein
MVSPPAPHMHAHACTCMHKVAGSMHKPGSPADDSEAYPEAKNNIASCFIPSVMNLRSSMEMGRMGSLVTGSLMKPGDCYNHSSLFMPPKPCVPDASTSTVVPKASELAECSSCKLNPGPGLVLPLLKRVITVARGRSQDSSHRFKSGAFLVVKPDPYKSVPESRLVRVRVLPNLQQPRPNLLLETAPPNSASEHIKSVPVHGH